MTSDDVTVVYGTTQRHLVNTSRELGVRGIFIFIQSWCDWHWYECAMPIMARARRITMSRLSSLRVASQTRAARYSGIEVTAPWEYSYCAIFSWIIAAITTKGEKRARSKTATIMKIVTVTSLFAKTLLPRLPRWKLIDLRTIVRFKTDVGWQSVSPALNRGARCEEKMIVSKLCHILF